jgi:hypothetical protein
MLNTFILDYSRDEGWQICGVGPGITRIIYQADDIQLNKRSLANVWKGVLSRLYQALLKVSGGWHSTQGTRLGEGLAGRVEQITPGPPRSIRRMAFISRNEAWKICGNTFWALSTRPYRAERLRSDQYWWRPLRTAFAGMTLVGIWTRSRATLHVRDAPAAAAAARA